MPYNEKKKTQVYVGDLLNEHLKKIKHKAPYPKSTVFFSQKSLNFVTFWIYRVNVWIKKKKSNLLDLSCSLIMEHMQKDESTCSEFLNVNFQAREGKG